MGARELREAFNAVAGQAATCTLALLNYKAVAGTQYSVLTFEGRFPDGSRFRIIGDQVRPGGDVIAAARATAQQLLDKPQNYKVAT